MFITKANAIIYFAFPLPERKQHKIPRFSFVIVSVRMVLEGELAQKSLGIHLEVADIFLPNLCRGKL